MITSLVLPLALAAAPSPCPAGSAVIMQCPAKAKAIAVCASPAANATSLQYRFGPSASIVDKPELVFPASASAGFSPFAFARQNLISGTSTTLTFTNGDVTYEVYTQDGKDAGGGVNVSKGGKIISTVACTGDFEEHWELVEGKFGAAAGAGGKTPSKGGPKPDPLAGKSMKEICEDDSLMLIKFKWDDLREKDTFKKNCCVKGALGNDDRCELDWPSSDMPDCDYFDNTRNGIFARFGYVFKDPRYQAMFGAESWYQPRADFDGAWVPKLAADNAAKLKVFACAKPSTAAACEQAAIKWSLQLQETTHQVDGSQQNDIAELLTAQCTKSGWGENVTACFIKGEPGCASSLKGQQLTDAIDGVRPINEDAANAMFPEMP